MNLLHRRLLDRRHLYQDLTGQCRTRLLHRHQLNRRHPCQDC